MADDRRRRYLRQQAELGGAEVLLDAPPARPAPRAPAPDTVPADTPSVPVVPVLPRSVAAPGSGTSGTERWRADAPPVPGPGLVIDVELPAPGDEIAALPSLEAVAACVGVCTRCSLATGRTRTVPGEGNPVARLMLVGEGPGGQAGQLLDKILEAIDLPREQVFIANIVKCRPPQNRKPLPDEVAACLPFLRRQIALVKPEVLLALGGTAAEGLLGSRRSLGELRGKVHRFAGIPLVVTYHPAALLRNPNWKKPTWDDVRIARQLLDR
ncbi:MAG: uracil-DNA glycosylase [Gemmatimonadales bacterium]|nr:uracil-DNA glycosylase [Gemmatimonadales bacterium]